MTIFPCSLLVDGRPQAPFTRSFGRCYLLTRDLSLYRLPLSNCRAKLHAWLNFEMYLFRFWNICILILKCISLDFAMYFLTHKRLLHLSSPTASARSSPKIVHSCKHVYIAKGRLSVPISMNFWKSSKRPLTPPPSPPFLGKMLRFFSTKIFGTEMTSPNWRL